ncbi:unnamed protein product [Jaminaea pallidilutea]
MYRNGHYHSQGPMPSHPQHFQQGGQSSSMNGQRNLESATNAQYPFMMASTAAASSMPSHLQRPPSNYHSNSYPSYDNGIPPPQDSSLGARGQHLHGPYGSQMPLSASHPASPPSASSMSHSPYHSHYASPPLYPPSASAHHPAYHAPPHQPYGNPTQSPPSGSLSKADQGSPNALGAAAARNGGKAVVRAACLSCRTAKRRCDGQQPVCGPCTARGIDEASGQCQYVASRRGGPRFKGCTGEEAKRMKAEKERMKHDRPCSDSPDDAMSGAARSSAVPSQSEISSADISTSFDGMGFGNSRSSSATAHQSAHPSSQTYTSPDRSMAMDDAAASSKYDPSHSNQFHHNAPHAAPHSLAMNESAAPLPSSHELLGSHSTPFYQPAQPAPAPMNESSALSASNLDMWQRIQESASTAGMEMNDSMAPMEIVPFAAGDAEIASLGAFYSRLESLPKAGEVGHASHGPNETLMDVSLTFDPDLEPHLLDGADSEQQARYLLTLFFSKVYASAPVLLAPENLSSLAFWFSGKGPCALYAAISALVTLRLPESEAHRTLRGGYQKSPRDGEEAGLTRKEIAAHHAQTSSFLLQRFSQQQAALAAASFGLDPKALSTGCDPDENGRALCQGPSDPELLRIEAAAAHTLLAHYYYGTGGHAGQRRAHEHALEAWSSLQGIRIELQEGVPPKDPLTTSHFNWEQKQEWAKRVYWTSFAAASVTGCTGGFDPIRFSLDAVAALKLRPALESDVGAWGVFIRGAQHVARGYTSLYNFEMLKSRKDISDEERAYEKARIYAEFSRLDRDMTAFCTYDPAWRSNPAAGSRASGLGFALRTAGKLMTAGATIIIHRGQAYANSHIFMDAHCGLPEASRPKRSSSGCCDNEKRPADPNRDHSNSLEEPDSPSASYVAPDRLWHRSGSTSLPPPGSGSGSGNAAPHAAGGGVLEPSVAALDATFIGWGANQHPSTPGTPAHEAATNTAMAAFQQFQVQAHKNRESSTAAMGSSPRNSGSSGGGSHPNSGANGRNGSASANSNGTPGVVVGNGNPFASALDQANGSDSPLTSPHLYDERYKYGPFEPETSANKCRWAASSMLESVSALLHGKEGGIIGSADEDFLGIGMVEAPSLPPWAACSYVLAGYCLLMQCLITQASRSAQKSAVAEPPSECQRRDGETSVELSRLRGQVMQLRDLLSRFSLTYEVAKDYRHEVEVLLQINKRLS